MMRSSTCMSSLVGKSNCTSLGLLYRSGFHIPPNQNIKPRLSLKADADEFISTLNSHEHSRRARLTGPEGNGQLRP